MKLFKSWPIPVNGWGGIKVHQDRFPPFCIYLNGQSAYYDRQLAGRSINRISRTAGLVGLLGQKKNEVNLELCDPDK